MDIALPPLFEYPGIPGILRRSQDHPGMDIALPPLSEYPGIPAQDDLGIVRVSQESQDTQTREVELYMSIPG